MQYFTWKLDFVSNYFHDCGFISISAFASLLGITIGIAISIIESQICPITSGYKSVIKKKKKRHGKISLLAKANLNSIEALICKILTESYISHNDFFVNNVLKRKFL